MNAATHWAAIGWMIVCGVLMGTAFDLYRVISHRFRFPRWLLPPLDIAYWTASTLGVFFVLLRQNHGEVRMYVFLGLGIGVSGYFGLLSPYVVKTANVTIRAVTVLSRGVWKTVRLLLVVPIFAIVRALAKLLDILFVVTAAVLIWTTRLLYKPFRPLVRRLWRKLAPFRQKIRSGYDRLASLAGRLKKAWDIFRKKS